MNVAAGWGARVREAVAAGQNPTPETIDGLVRERADTLGRRGVHSEVARLSSALLGLGELASVVAEPEVTDVLVNGDGSVWVDRGRGVERSPVRVAVSQTRPLAVRLAAMAGRRLDDAQPWVDGLLPDGIRLHAVVPPLVESGAHVSLRVPRVFPSSVAALVELGTCSPVTAEILRGIVRSRRSFLVCGGTGSGKTTLLAALLAECDAAERLVLVEDVRELSPVHPHVVRLQGRAANVEGFGLVTMTDLVRQALRMRPDRLIVGEVRGAEVRELLAALNTGHSGSAGTVHANTARDVPARLQALGALAGLSTAAVDAQVASGIDLVVAMRRVGAARVVSEIGVVARSPSGGVEVRCAWSGPGIRGPSEPVGSGMPRAAGGVPPPGFAGASAGPGPAWEECRELLGDALDRRGVGPFTGAMGVGA